MLSQEQGMLPQEQGTLSQEQGTLPQDRGDAIAGTGGMMPSFPAGSFGR